MDEELSPVRLPGEIAIQEGWGESSEALAELHAPPQESERMAVPRPALPQPDAGLAAAVRAAVAPAEQVYYRRRGAGPLTIVPGRYVHSSPLTYQIDRLIEQHEIAIERATAVPDEFGGELDPLWALHATLPGLFWWWPTHGAGRFVEEATPQRSVDITGGGCLFPLGTDVTELDRIATVSDPDKNLEVEGPLRIVSLRELPTHLELSVERP